MSPEPDSSSEPSERQPKSGQQLEDEQSIAQAIGRQLRKRLQLRRVVSSLTLYGHSCMPEFLVCRHASPFSDPGECLYCQVARPDRHSSIGAGALSAPGPIRAFSLGPGRHAAGHSMLPASHGLRYSPGQPYLRACLQGLK